MLPESITIIGCGTVGSVLSQKLLTLSYDYPLKEVILIDFDILDEKNLPYLHIRKKTSKFLYLPKVDVLASLLTEINPKVKIKKMREKYPCQLPDGFRIDCRDSKDTCFDTNIRLNYDGIWGSVVVNPITYISEKSNSRYRFKLSKYLVEKFCFKVIDQIILKWREHEEIKNMKYMYNLKVDEDYYVFTNQ